MYHKTSTVFNALISKLQIRNFDKIIVILLFPSFLIYEIRYKGRVTTTACASYCEPVLSRYVDFHEEGKPEYQEKNPRSTGEINNGNLTHMKYHTRLGFSSKSIGGPKMSRNFVRERQRIVYIYIM